MRKDLSKTALLRQALRLYQLVDSRFDKGDKLFFEDEVTKDKAELVVLSAMLSAIFSCLTGKRSVLCRRPSFVHLVPTRWPTSRHTGNPSSNGISWRLAVLRNARPLSSRIHIGCGLRRLPQEPDRSPTRRLQ